MEEPVERVQLRDEVGDLIAHEADCLDRRRWREWLDLFTEDAEFWVPAWRSEDETTDNPKLELNLIYLHNRGMLEDRVFRFSSGDSYASTPLPTTSHVVASLRILAVLDGRVDVSAKAVTVSVDPRRGSQIRGAWYDYQLARQSGRLRIARKKVTLLEQIIDGTVDVYSV